MKGHPAAPSMCCVGDGSYISVCSANFLWDCLSWSAEKADQPDFQSFPPVVLYSSFVSPSLPIPPGSNPFALTRVLCSLDRQTHVRFFEGGIRVIVFACWK